jgi:hypothetical protein
VRCEECGARNPESAAWCSQCYTPLGAAHEEPGPETAELQEPVPGASQRQEAVREAAQRQEPAPAAPAEPASRDVDETARESAEKPAPGAAAQDRIREGESGFEWRCETCGTWVALDEAACGVCGTRFRLSPEEEKEVVDREPGLVLAASALLPGAGHILLGRAVDGWVRAGTYAAWLAGAVLLLVTGRGTEIPVLPAVPLVLGAVALLGVSMLDAARLARGEHEQVLTPRVYLWLVVGVVGLLVLGFLPGLLRIGQVGG